MEEEGSENETMVKKTAKKGRRVLRKDGTSLTQLDEDLGVGFVEPAVKAQVRDLRYNSGNLYPNCIIRHMLMKLTDHPPGICGWGVRMALKGLDIRKCVFSGLASCMFTIRYISIVFCCSLFMCYHWVSLWICSCI